MTRIEGVGEGAYGYSVLRGGGARGVGSGAQGVVGGSARLPSRAPCPGGCPMCYHTAKEPCPSCGCPSTQARHRPAIPTPEFFSPTSDYHSLSPTSPPPSSTSPSSSSPPPSSSPQPIYATVNKPKASPEKKVMEVAKEEQEVNKSENEVGDTGKEGKDVRDPVKEEPRKTSLPLYPERVGERGVRGPPGERGVRGPPGEGRRHSWATSRGPPAAKQTSLQDFKKLLAQQTPGSNPHRVSARELLERGAGEEPGHPGGGGSLRKARSPWKDQRFSVIQEEPGEEGRSRESLLNGRR